LIGGREREASIFPSCKSLQQFAFGIGPAYIDSADPCDGMGLNILPKFNAGVERAVPFSACKFCKDKLKLLKVHLIKMASII
jgi:hypothetical protein